jgi:hypothetical protein
MSMLSAINASTAENILNITASPSFGTESSQRVPARSCALDRQYEIVEANEPSIHLQGRLDDLIYDGKPKGYLLRLVVRTENISGNCGPLIFPEFTLTVR